MKIKLTQEMKRVITIDKMEAIEAVRAGMKEQKNFQWEAERAQLLAANGFSAEILKVDSEIALNNRVWNYYSENSEDVDIWIKVIAYSPVLGCFDIELYLSDIWSLGSENHQEIKSHMFIRHLVDNECI